MQKKSSRWWWVICWLGLGSTQLHAQLDTMHWIPPVFGGTSVAPQYLELTTPETTPFTVTVRDGSGAFVKSFVISNSQPERYLLSDTYSQVLVADVRVQEVLKTGAGLVLQAPKPFYASLRVANATNAAHLTCKGRAAPGRVFRIVQVIQVTDKTGARKNAVGIMATEDNTQVTFSEFDPLLAEMGGGAPVTITLQKGESYVFAHFVGTILDEQPKNGFLGALLTATHPVVVNTASWLGAPVVYVEANDIGLDQQLPLEQVGDEYIFCQGTGPASWEHPLLVAHYDNTQVWINGAAEPEVTLQAGERFSVPMSFYLPIGNTYVRTSKPVFAGQMLGAVKDGLYSLRAGSFVIVPPLHCGRERSLNNVFKPAQIENTRYDGALMMVAQRDATVTVRVNGTVVPLDPPTDVRGTDDFVVYRMPEFFQRTGPVANTFSVESDGAIVTTISAWRLDAAFAATFSGAIIRQPAVQLTLHGDGICPDTLTAAGEFDGVRWVYEDSTLLEGPSTLLVRAPGRYKAIAYLNGCRNTATVVDSLDVPLAAPTFPFRAEEPSCFGFSDGLVVFGPPNGGTPPYQYSIDFGQTLSSDTLIEGVRAGLHKLVVLDAAGCYNQPLRLTLGQPDSVSVRLQPTIWPRPLRPGALVELMGVTQTATTATTWNPPDSSGCANCLTYQFRPTLSTWITLTVTDENGCPGTDSLWVEVEPPVFAPNSVAPGSIDGNGRFYLSSWKPLPVQQLVIFDRWGALLFEKRNFLTNNPDDGWDGTLAGGGNAPVGVYAFAAQVEVEPGRVVLVKGDVLVVR